MLKSQTNICKPIEKKKVEQSKHQNLGTDIEEILELSDWEFKIAMIIILSTLMETCKTFKK